MKRIFVLLLCALALVPYSCSKKAETIKVMSYNIRYGTADDGEFSWPLRREAAAAMVLDQKPAVFGVQEALPMQLDYL